MSDIVFGDHDQIDVLCSNLSVHGTDLVLDSPARRTPSGPVHRRALVHDEGDGLTINFQGDYPGGVSVGGSLGVVGQLLVRGGISFETEAPALGHTAQTTVMGPGTVLIRTQVDLAQVLADLKARVERLEARP